MRVARCAAYYSGRDRPAYGGAVFLPAEVREDYRGAPRLKITRH